MKLFRTESIAMRFFRAIGLEGVAWSLRRVHCPVPRDALVLEVGSGGNPYARANVLLDAYEVTRERHWAPLKADRPTMLGFVERLPFRDKAFDFAIASHVFEHSARPEQFLAELQRVAKAGYIEVPDAFMERINPYRDHRLEITCRENRLIIRKKQAWIVERDTVALYEHKVKPFLTRELISRRPFAFHVRYYWHEKIDFTVVNPDTDAAWPADRDAKESAAIPLGIKARLHSLVLDMIRAVLSQNRRNRRINLFDFLICTGCGSAALEKATEGIRCNDCGAFYAVRRGIPVMYPQPSAVTEKSQCR
jgi:SAM-dependent methyltransferase